MIPGLVGIPAGTFPLGLDGAGGARRGFTILGMILSGGHPGMPEVSMTPGVGTDGTTVGVAMAGIDGIDTTMPIMLALLMVCITAVLMEDTISTIIAASRAATW